MSPSGGLTTGFRWATTSRTTKKKARKPRSRKVRASGGADPPPISIQINTGDDEAEPSGTAKAYEALKAEPEWTWV